MGLEVCPICAGPKQDISIHYETGVVNEAWAKCESCNLFFVRNMPDPEKEFGRYASGEYRHGIMMKWAKRAGRSPEKVFFIELMNEAMRAQHIIMVLDGNGYHPKRFLDVGASLGVLALAVKASWKDSEVWGVEPFLENVIANGVVDGMTFVRSLNEVVGTFDVITCIHTLEHIPNPIEFLSTIAKHLEPDGHLIIEVPHLDLITGSDENHPLNNPFHKDHMFTYTVDGLAKVIKLAGLRPDTYRLHGHLFHLGTNANLLFHVTKGGVE